MLPYTAALSFFLLVNYIRRGGISSAAHQRVPRNRCDPRIHPRVSTFRALISILLHAVGASRPLRRGNRTPRLSTDAISRASRPSLQSDSLRLPIVLPLVRFSVNAWLTRAWCHQRSSTHSSAFFPLSVSTLCFMRPRRRFLRPTLCLLSFFPPLVVFVSEEKCDHAFFTVLESSAFFWCASVVHFSKAGDLKLD